MTATHESGLLAAVIASPADDGPRLVLADWLEEHGQPERGEFIRVQCELARLPGWILDSAEYRTRGLCPECDCTARHTDGCKFGRLSRRADELWRANGLKWVTPLAELLRLEPTRWHCSWYPPGIRRRRIDPEVDDVYEFRRGFVASVTLTAEAWLGGVCECYGLNPRVVAGEASWEDCPRCHGTGRTPGHADALVKATPLEVVRLTTWPNREQMLDYLHASKGKRPIGDEVDALTEAVCTGSVVGYLESLWPGIAFELPASAEDFRRITGQDVARAAVDAFNEAGEALFRSVTESYGEPSARVPLPPEEAARLDTLGRRPRDPATGRFVRRRPGGRRPRR